MEPQFVLALLVVGLFAAVGVWDVVCYIDHQPDKTVSNIIGTWATEYPMFTFAAGALAGHLLWPRSPFT